MVDGHKPFRLPGGELRPGGWPHKWVASFEGIDVAGDTQAEAKANLGVRVAEAVDAAREGTTVVVCGDGSVLVAACRGGDNYSVVEWRAETDGQRPGWTNSNRDYALRRIKDFPVEHGGMIQTINV